MAIIGFLLGLVGSFCLVLFYRLLHYEDFRALGHAGFPGSQIVDLWGRHAPKIILGFAILVLALGLYDRFYGDASGAPVPPVRIAEHLLWFGGTLAAGALIGFPAAQWLYGTVETNQHPGLVLLALAFMLSLSLLVVLDREHNFFARLEGLTAGDFQLKFAAGGSISLGAGQLGAAASPGDSGMRGMTNPSLPGFNTPPGSPNLGFAIDQIMGLNRAAERDAIYASLPLAEMQKATDENDFQLFYQEVLGPLAVRLRLIHNRLQSRSVRHILPPQFIDELRLVLLRRSAALQQGAAASKDTPSLLVDELDKVFTNVEKLAGPICDAMKDDQARAEEPACNAFSPTRCKRDGGNPYCLAKISPTDPYWLAASAIVIYASGEIGTAIRMLNDWIDGSGVLYLREQADLARVHRMRMALLLAFMQAQSGYGASDQQIAVAHFSKVVDEMGALLAKTDPAYLGGRRIVPAYWTEPGKDPDTGECRADDLHAEFFRHRFPGRKEAPGAAELAEREVGFHRLMYLYLLSSNIMVYEYSRLPLPEIEQFYGVNAASVKATADKLDRINVNCFENLFYRPQPGKSAEDLAKERKAARENLLETEYHIRDTVSFYYSQLVLTVADSLKPGQVSETDLGESFCRAVRANKRALTIRKHLGSRFVTADDSHADERSSAEQNSIAKQVRFRHRLLERLGQRYPDLKKGCPIIELSL